MIVKWRGVGQRVAEEVFEGARERVVRMGGVRGWQGMEMSRSKGGGGGWWEDGDNDHENSSYGHEEKGGGKEKVCIILYSSFLLGWCIVDWRCADVSVW